MDASLPLDPLIAEAKQRMRRRRTMVVAIGLLAGATVLTIALRPWGGSPADRGAHVEPKDALSQLRVPLDAGERHWRSLLPIDGGPAPRSAIVARRREVAQALAATGATLVRLKVWRRMTPPAVELVVATSTDSAIFAGRRFMRLVAIRRPDYVRVVDAHGSMTFVWGGAGNEGFVGSAPALAGCIAGMHGGLAGASPPRCPVR